jgi:hypothetical protein
MKPTILALILALFSGIVLAQTFSGATKRLAASQAVKIASGLRVGMGEADADRFLESHGISGRIVGTNGAVIIYSQRVGDNFGWDTIYPLKDECYLHLDYTATKIRTNWGGDGLLNRAFIQSNGVDIVFVTFTNAP